MVKKISSALIVCIMVLSVAVLTAFAADGNVAKIGNTEYATLQAAIDAGGEITLIADTTEAMVTVKAGTSVDVDFNGKTLNGSMFVEKGATANISNGTILQTNTVAGIEVQGVATLANMNITSARHAIRVDGLNTEGTVLTVNSGTYQTKAPTGWTAHTINAGEGSTVIINGGEFIGAGKANQGGAGNAIMVKDHVTVVVVNGGVFSDANGSEGVICAANSLTISGGKFDNGDKGWSYDNYLAEGKIATKNADGYYEVADVVAKVGDKYFATLNDAVKAVNGAAVIEIFVGTHKLDNLSMQDKEITFKGAKNVIIDATANSAKTNGATLKFSGIQIDWKKQNDGYQGFTHIKKVVYEDCIITGTQFMYGDADFINCVFESGQNADGTNYDGYNVYGRGTGKLTFVDCTFNTGGRAIMLYNDGYTKVDVTLTRCNFKDNGAYTSKDKAAVETGDNLYIEPAKTSVFNIAFNSCTVEGFEKNNSTSPLWGNKDNMPSDRLNVVINGKNETTPEVIKAGDSTYTTLGEAIKNVATNETITVEGSSLMTGSEKVFEDAMKADTTQTPENGSKEFKRVDEITIIEKAENKLVLDITPKMVVTTKNAAGNVETKETELELTGTDVTITFDVNEFFENGDEVNVYHAEENGEKTLVDTVTVADGKITFTTSAGFSEYSFESVDSAADAAIGSRVAISRWVNSEGKYEIWMFAGIDSLNYKEVGFDVSTDDNNNKSFSTKTVYSSIKDSENKVYYATDFSTESYNVHRIFAAGIWVDVDYAKARTIKFKPYAVKLDGTKIYGSEMQVGTIFKSDNA